MPIMRSPTIVMYLVMTILAYILQIVPAQCHSRIIDCPRSYVLTMMHDVAKILMALLTQSSVHRSSVADISKPALVPCLAGIESFCIFMSHAFLQNKKTMIFPLIVFRRLYNNIIVLLVHYLYAFFLLKQLHQFLRLKTQ